MRKTKFTKAELDLARRFGLAMLKVDPPYNGFAPRPMTRDVVKTVVKMLKLHGNIQEGASRTTFITNAIVLKVDRGGDVYALEAECEKIERLRRGPFGKHFPLTEYVWVSPFASRFGGLQIQEAIPHRDNPIPMGYRTSAIDFGYDIGMQDLHTANFGWIRTSRSTYPVYFDFDCGISAPQSQKSWEKYLSSYKPR